MKQESGDKQDSGVNQELGQDPKQSDKFPELPGKDEAKTYIGWVVEGGGGGGKFGAGCRWVVRKEVGDQEEVRHNVWWVVRK